MTKKDKDPRKETAIARREHQDDLSINKRDGFNFDFGYDRIDKTMKLCESIAQSGMVPREYQNAPKKVLVAAAMGARFGLDPLQSTQSIAVVSGTPTFYGDALLGMVKSSGKEEWTLEGVKAMEYVVKQSDIYKKWCEHYEYKPSKIAFCVTKRKGEEEPTIQHYTIDQAKEAGLLSKDNWKKNKVRMLQMRARSFALRDEYPDVLKGYNTYEEMVDVDDDKAYAQEPLPDATGEFVESDEWNDVSGQEEEEDVIDADVEEIDDEEEEPEKEEEEVEDTEKDRSLRSDDMLAEDAIEQIELFDKLSPLWAFVDEDYEDRVTVLDAYKKREEKLKEEMNDRTQEELPPDDEDIEQDDTDLFANEEDNNNASQGSFDAFDEAFDEEEPI